MVDRVPAVGAPVYVGRDEAGLVVRVRGESDRHVRLVQVTDAGRAVTDQEDEAYRGLAAGFLDPLTLEDTRLARLLGRVVGAPETGAGGTA